LDEEYRNEMLGETKLEVQEGIIGNDDPDSQEDYFQNPIQQHDANVKNNDKPERIILGTDTKKNKRSYRSSQQLFNTQNSGVREANEKEGCPYQRPR
jgi:hypothetical protein